MELKRPNDIPRSGESGRARLAALADFVEQLPPGTLTFSRWYGQGRGCAVGQAAARDPWFAAQGLRLEREESLKDCRPSYAGLSDWDAVATFFELTPEAARQLFDRAGYDGQIRPEPAAVAGKIRHHLARTEVGEWAEAGEPVA